MERRVRKKVLTSTSREKKNGVTLNFSLSFFPRDERRPSFRALRLSRALGPPTEQLVLRAMAREIKVPISPGRRTTKTTSRGAREGMHRRQNLLARICCRSLAPVALALLLCFARGARALPGEKGKELEIQSLEVGAERGFDCFNFAWHIPSLDLGPRLPLSRRLPSVPFQKLSLVAAGSFSLALSPSRRSAR